MRVLDLPEPEVWESYNSHPVIAVTQNGLIYAELCKRQDGNCGLYIGGEYLPPSRVLLIDGSETSSAKAFASGYALIPASHWSSIVNEVAKQPPPLSTPICWQQLREDARHAYELRKHYWLRHRIAAGLLGCLAFFGVPITVLWLFWNQNVWLRAIGIALAVTLMLPILIALCGSVFTDEMEGLRTKYERTKQRCIQKP